LRNKTYIEEFIYSKSKIEKDLTQNEIKEMLLKNLIEATSYGYKFAFVGVLSFPLLVITIIPKVYLEEIRPEDKVAGTVKCLKTYAGSNKHFYDGVDYFNFNTDLPDCSELPVAEFILMDFETMKFIGQAL
jgi:hypothetical protein